MSITNKLIRSSLLSGLLLQGCVSVGPNYKRPDIATPAAYQPAEQPTPPEVRYAAGLPSGAWWSAFQSAELNSAVENALTNSPTIAEADARLRSVAATYRAVRAADLPSADLRAGRVMNRINLASFGFAGQPAIPFDAYSVGADVSYDLDIFGGQRRSKEAAQARLDAQSNQAAAARLSLAGNVVLQALEIASLQSQIRAAEEVVASDKETVALAKKAIELGAQPAVSGLAPDTQLAQDEAVLPPLQSRMAAARNQFALLLGEAPGAAATPNFTLAGFSAPADTPVALPSELLRRRPDVLAAEASLHASVADVGVATADLFPKLKLSADIAQTATSLSKVFNYDASGWNYGASLAAPLFHGGALRARVGVAKADADAASARYRATVLRALVEVANAMSALKYDSDALTAQQKALDTARANLDARKRLFELGRGDIMDTLDAQRQANIALRAKAAAEGQRLKTLATLYAATATIDVGTSEKR